MPAVESAGKRGNGIRIAGGETKRRDRRRREILQSPDGGRDRRPSRRQRAPVDSRSESPPAGPCETTLRPAGNGCSRAPPCRAICRGAGAARRHGKRWSRPRRLPRRPSRSCRRVPGRLAGPPRCSAPAKRFRGGRNPLSTVAWVAKTATVSMGRRASSGPAVECQGVCAISSIIGAMTPRIRRLGKCAGQPALLQRTDRRCGRGVAGEDDDPRPGAKQQGHTGLGQRLNLHAGLRP